MNSLLHDSDIVHSSSDKNGVFSSQSQLLHDASDVTKRRSSNRSIKRKKFDDELVEYSLGLPGISNIKSGRSRTQSSHSEFSVTSPSVPSTTITSVPTMQSDIRRKPISKSMSGGYRRSKKGRQQNQIATKDLGRWKPTDDLALIIGVQQTNDLRTVHLVSRVAIAAMRNLHPDMVAAVQDRALWSTQEEQILSTVKSQSNPDINTFSEMLSQHPEVFYSGRTAAALQKHWNTLRMYHLLPDQMLVPLPTAARPVLAFSDAEDLIQDSELSEPSDEMLDRELRLQQRRNIREIRQLENEIGRWNVLVDSVTGVCPGELDSQTLAVLRGRMVRYLMRSREITIGRSAKGHNVDIDLALEGPAHKVSRRQGTLRLRNTGEFYLSSEGKRPIFVDGRPITTADKYKPTNY
ncbi:N-terminal region of micro-spherule protein [Popillia japonica]|uniref:N-terminal region of micro-spherule protein n=1 Tax=Popillia japonica TaxID=7064 RepID=A0AAW1K2I2_POPJA